MCHLSPGQTNARAASAAGWLQKAKREREKKAEKRPSQYLRFKSIFAIRALALNGLGTNNKRRGRLKKETKSSGSLSFLLCERAQRSPYIVL